MAAGPSHAAPPRSPEHPAHVLASVPGSRASAFGQRTHGAIGLTDNRSLNPSEEQAGPYYTGDATQPRLKRHRVSDWPRMAVVDQIPVIGYERSAIIALAQHGRAS